MPDSFSLRSRFGIRFTLLARRWRQVLDVQLASTGLTDATWVPLIHLKETGGGLTQKDLAARAGIQGSSLVRIIDILVRQGLVERRRDAADGRARRIHLTDAGEQRVAGIRRELARGEEAMLADLSDEDIATMLDHLGTLERRIVALEQGNGGAE